MEPVCRAAAAGRGRGAGRTVGGRSAAAARDRQAACALPPRRYVVVRPVARSGAARVDRRAAVAAGRVVARLSGGRHAQPLRRAMAPSPPTGPSPHPARQRRGRRSGTGLRGRGGARRYSAVVCVGQASTESDYRTDQRHGSRRYPSSLRSDRGGIRYDTPTNTAIPAAPRFGLVLAMTRTRYPQSGLAMLLDALERELLAAPVDEVREAWRGTDRARNIARQEIRALLNEAIAASEEDAAAIPPPDTWTGLNRRLIVSRELRAAPRDHPHPGAFSASSRRRH